MKIDIAMQIYPPLRFTKNRYQHGLYEGIDTLFDQMDGDCYMSQNWRIYGPRLDRIFPIATFKY